VYLPLKQRKQKLFWEVCGGVNIFFTVFLLQNISGNSAKTKQGKDFKSAGTIPKRHNIQIL